MRHLIDIRDLTEGEIDGILTLAERIMEDPDSYRDACRGKKLATLFYEPSTRTRLSFEAAMIELGGHAIGFSDGASSSASKGESVQDTVRMAGCYADLIAMRHPKEGAPLAASLKSAVPVVNAGDGGHNHPTQTLTDLLTIRREAGGFAGLTVGLCGDLMFGRTVHSLILALSRYEGVRFELISPVELRAPEYLTRERLSRGGVPYGERESLDEVIGELDILYMTRVQRERFFNEADYVRLKDSFILTAATLARAKPGLKVLHPLPRVNEIAAEVDDDPRACYFRQALYGKYARMALILWLLEARE